MNSNNDTIHQMMNGIDDTTINRQKLVKLFKIVNIPERGSFSWFDCHSLQLEIYGVLSPPECLWRFRTIVLLFMYSNIPILTPCQTISWTYTGKSLTKSLYVSNVYYKSKDGVGYAERKCL